MEKINTSSPILHVVVIGFHHKKGCQVEYSYPPMIDGEPVNSSECPEEWKHLSSLALPDGSHNYEQDVVYFHMPSRKEYPRTVFGISCYRQINAESLVNRSADVTRGTVQKSVCILSTLPLYGLITAKLELITHAYFDEKDFSKVALLQETYNNLNACLSEEHLIGQQIYLGLSVRDLVLQFKHKIVMLFKLILLEKKVIFLKSPVKELCTPILSLLSLFPGMIEKGLLECTAPDEAQDVIAKSEDGCIEKNGSYDSEIKNEMDTRIPEKMSKDTEEHFVSYLDVSKNKSVRVSPEITSKIRQSKKPKSQNIPESVRDEKHFMSDLEELLDGDHRDLSGSKLEFQDRDWETILEKDLEDNDDVHSLGSLRSSESSLTSKGSLTGSTDGISRVSSFRGRVAGAFSYWTSRDGNEEIVVVAGDEDNVRKPWVGAMDATSVDICNCGMPLSIFSKGVMCHPYLSLQYLDVLRDPRVHGFVVGATNVLFKQKRNLADVIVEIEDGKVDILDLDLRRILHLTTEDLRFADFLVRNVTEDRQDVFLDGTGWEGGDEWIRAQFKLYLVCMLRTSLLEEGSRELEAYNSSFIAAWQKTRNGKRWIQGEHLGVLEVNPGHPYQGQLSMSDMKLRISHTMQSSERGRKINEAVASTGRAVAQTGKALGGALTNAKSAVSSWLHTFTSAPQEVEQAEEVETK